jgi:hypothetical protein
VRWRTRRTQFRRAPAARKSASKSFSEKKEEIERIADGDEPLERLERVTEKISISLMLGLIAAHKKARRRPAGSVAFL